MRIENYQFGRIAVGGQTYTSDVIISEQQVQDSWWRREGHRLDIHDLDVVMTAKPQTLVVGTGYYGRMEVPDETRRFLETHDVKLVAAPTREAVDEFNRLQQECANIVATLHLTC